MIKYLAINECARGHGATAIVIEDEDHNGVRINGTKCCGAWVTRERWPLASWEWRELAEHAMDAAEEMEANE